MDRRFVILLFLSLFHCVSQAQEVELITNRANIRGIAGYKTIQVTTTYSEGDYRSEDFHYYNDLNQNYLTVAYYKDTLQSVCYFEFDKQGRLKRLKRKGDWSSGVLDTTKIEWISNYAYYPNGSIKKVEQIWFHDDHAEFKDVISYKYNDKNKLIKEERIIYDLNSFTEKVYFEPNSNELSQNQNPPPAANYTQKYTYLKNKIIIKNYQNNLLKSRLVRTTHGDSVSTLLIDTLGNLVRKNIIFKNNKSQVVKEVISGETDISDFLEFGDGGVNDTTIYSYNKSGLLELITCEDRRHDWKTFTKFKYIKK